MTLMQILKKLSDKTIAKVVFDTNYAGVKLSVTQQSKVDCFLSSTNRFIAEYTVRIT